MRFLFSILFLFVFNSSAYPKGIINEVLDEQNGISERNKLYAELAHYESEKNKAAGDFIRHYLLVDTISSAADSIKVMISLTGYGFFLFHHPVIR